ncbi:hypothetical protein ACJX0J_019219, partial [Zea mays]
TSKERVMQLVARASLRLIALNYTIWTNRLLLSQSTIFKWKLGWCRCHLTSQKFAFIKKQKLSLQRRWGIHDNEHTACRPTSGTDRLVLRLACLGGNVTEGLERAKIHYYSIFKKRTKIIYENMGNGMLIYSFFLFLFTLFFEYFLPQCATIAYLCLLKERYVIYGTIYVIYGTIIMIPSEISLFTKVIYINASQGFNYFFNTFLPQVPVFYYLKERYVIYGTIYVIYETM